MAKTLKVRAIPSNLEVGGRNCYRILPVGCDTINTDAFVKLFAEALRLKSSDAQFTLDKFWEVCQSCLLENKAIELEFMSMRLVIEGSLNSMNEQPTLEKNPVRIRIIVKGEAAREAAAIRLENVTEMIEAALHEIMQEGASGLSRIENDGVITINGKGLKIDPSAEDEGVYLAKNGIVIKRAEILYSAENSLEVKFADLDIENGVYELCVATRNGTNPAKVSARIVTRKVTLAK